jgi:hypothetical protein
MPAIADQVTKLEHDHDDALANIDTLKAANAALTDALNAVTAEKAALEAKVGELSEYADGLIAMADGVANSALNMLKAARLPKGTPAAVIPYAPKTVIERLQAAGIVDGHATDSATDATAAQNTGAVALSIDDVVDRLGQVLINDDMPKPAPAQSAAPELAVGGDTAHLRLVTTADAPLVPAPPSAVEPMTLPTAESPISAVDRIKRHFLPAVTLMRRPADLKMRVDHDHDPGGLPMFLRRDTAFALAASR